MKRLLIYRFFFSLTVITLLIVTVYVHCYSESSNLAQRQITAFLNLLDVVNRRALEALNLSTQEIKCHAFSKKLLDKS